MNKLLLTALAIFAFCPTFSQDDHEDLARSFHKKEDRFNAVLNAVEALKNYAVMKKGTLSRMQEILTEDYGLFMKYSNQVIAVKKRDTENPSDNTRLSAHKNIVSIYEQMVQLQNKVKELPTGALVSKDNEQFGVLSQYADFKPDLENANKGLEEAKLKIAEKHYVYALGLKSSADFEEVIEAYDEFGKVSDLSPGYKNSAAEREGLKSVIATLYLEKGKKVALGKTPDDIGAAIKLFDEGLIYNPGNAQLIAAKRDANKSLLGAYLDEGRKLSLKKNVEDIGSAIKLFDQGLLLFPGNTDLIAAKTDATTFIMSLYFDQVGKYLAPENLKKTPLDNGYAALILIEKLKKSLPYGTPSSKPLQDLEQRALLASATPFRDERDGNTYKTTRVGEQIWIAENLKYEGNGGKFITVTDTSGNKQIEKRLGVFYTFRNAMNNTLIEKSQGVCPNGWHIPSKDELVIMKQIVLDNAKGWKLNRKEEPELWENSLWFKMNFHQLATGSSAYYGPNDDVLTMVVGKNLISSTKIAPTASFDTAVKFDYLMFLHDSWEDYKITLGRDLTAFGSDMKTDGMNPNDVKFWYPCRCIKNALTPTK